MTCGDKEFINKLRANGYDDENSGSYIGGMYVGKVVLDGDFSVAELETIIKTMKQDPS